MKHFILFCGLMLSAHLFSQNLSASVDWGSKKVEFPLTNVAMAGTSKGNPFVYGEPYGLMSYVNGKPKNYIKIVQYDKELNVVSQGRASLRHRGRGRSFEQLFMLQNQLLFFTSYFNEEKQKNYLMVERLDHDRFKPLTQPKVLLSISEEKRNNRGRFNTLISPDSSKFLAFTSHQEPADSSEYIKFILLDSRCQELWRKSVIFPYTEKALDIKCTILNNEGDVFLYGRLTLTDEEVKAREAQGIPTPYRTVRKLFAYRKNGTEVREYELPPWSKGRISQIKFRFKKNGDILCAGFYEYDGLLKGSFHFTLDPGSGQQTDLEITPFGQSFLDELKSGKNSIASFLLKHMYLDYFQIMKDGSILLVGEEYFQREHSYTYYFDDADGHTDWKTITELYHYYLDVLVVKYRPDGQLDWYQRVPKIQRDTNPKFGSYRLLIDDDEVRVVFNGQLVKKGNSRKAVSEIALVNRGGSVYSKELPAEEQQGFYFLPSLSFRYKDDQLVFMTRKRHLYRMGKLRF
ncbi:MAG: hypothetical protein AAF206_20870 [Bacteroidota bacterium]